ncbi:transcriptional antiterminator [Virgibacillus natechei]|uniref:Transcriptional antiterminator n=1 Tax=Virgibacillus natechei TaxID=1216297 RepID=A0ABS4IJJ1_9BACI|nr:PRD domain-containing protein [Virgibacillus natechei]MBP1971104.1 transcriptional antiterminator [Virgibacillus natechei]UZD12209.1 PRD domain-containing protein [Virgibacillus natechei]
MDTFIVNKVLNNNVLIAIDHQDGEVVLIGKGIGFNKKKDELIRENSVEKMFVLRNEKEQEYYKELLPQIEENILNTIISSIEMIRSKSDVTLNEQAHVALTDHILFAVTRLMKGMEIRNPFLTETKALYPFEYEIAAEVVDFINHSLDIDLPEGEVGFIALHVHAAMTNMAISDINKYSQLVKRLTETIESQLDIMIQRDSIHYIRLVRHIRYTIERVLKEEKVEEPEKIVALLKKEYPVCYNLSWKLIKIMQQTLKKPVYNAEAVYLTMHLQRLTTKYE